MRLNEGRILPIISAFWVTGELHLNFYLPYTETTINLSVSFQNCIKSDRIFLSLGITRSQLLPPGFSSNNAPRPEARFNPLRPRGEKQEQDRKGKSSCEEALSALRHPEMAG